MKKALESNIWKYTLFKIANKRVYVAILSAYYLTIPNTTAQSIGIILLAGNIAGFLLEIPSGYISDKLGHKQALVLSRIALILSTLFFLFANSLFFLVLGSIFLSIGQAFISGTGSAFMHETLRGLGKEKDYAKIMGKMNSIGFAVPIILTVLTPFLVSISFKTPFLIGLIVDVVGFIIALALVAPPVSQEQIDEIGVTNFRQVIKAGHKLNFFPFALFSGVMMGILFSIGGFRAAYQILLGVPVIWYGVLFGVGRGLASLMLAYSGKIHAKTTLFSFYRFQILLYTALILLLGVFTSWQVVVIAFILINSFQWGLSTVNSTYLLEIIKTSNFKATLLSTKAQIERVIAGIIGISLGFAIESLTYQYGFLFLALSFVVLTVPLYFYISTKHRDIVPTPLPEPIVVK